ncbi:GDP-mannose 4,6-dehydratase [Nocardioides sp. Y6]|uniref:GDP-mannose 4,6-dehydratase n=1 Tax=Nocardioides malaquae TaxID=2773426 RepID=A0ABR9RT92_9ACTN|nr:GDP-mannose 4,6-dehydratase [Nocardioides malaquae]MBE7324793.1 GDP-mannose 4,6-dehydratase [Nocardioides malaquae]
MRLVPRAGFRRAFVTGIGGQNGSYLAERLAEWGVEVHGLVRSQQRPTHLPAGVRLHVGDVSDHDRVREVLREVRPNAVANLAAMSSVAASWKEPELCRAVNRDAALALLDAVEELSDERHPIRFVQASSAEMFGTPEVSPQDESTPIAPTSPYGEAKADVHRAVGEARARGLHASSLILYNHESPRRPRTFVTRKITSTVAAIVKGRADELVLGNLDARRDWGWAPDFVDAFLRAGSHDEPDDYVVATGQAHSVRDFVGSAFAAAGIADWESYVRVDESLLRPVDAVELVGDATRARTKLGWQPTKRFDQIVAAMVRHDLKLLSRP